MLSRKVLMRNLISMVLLCAGSTAMAQPGAGLLPALGPNATLLSITAEGQSRRRPDVAMFSAGVVTQAKTAAEALSANADRMHSVVAALKKAGVADRDIQTAALSLQPQFYYPERDRAMRERVTGVTNTSSEPQAPRIIGYEARNNVQVRVRRLAEMGRIIDTLVTAGANQVEGPSFTVDEPQSALDEARTQAMQRARERADLYASAAGLRVSRILSITEGGAYYPVQEVAMRGGMMSAPPPPPSPVAPGELTLGINLSVQFALER
jgi:uncharacterized protein YggE